MVGLVIVFFSSPVSGEELPPHVRNSTVFFLQIPFFPVLYLTQAGTQNCANTADGIVSELRLFCCGVDLL